MGPKIDVQVIHASAAKDAQCCHARNRNRSQSMAITSRYLYGSETHHSIVAQALADMAKIL